MRDFHRSVPLALAILILPLVATARTAPPDRSKQPELVGTWTGTLVVDEERLAKQLQKSGTPADEVEAAVEKRVKQIGRQSIEVHYRADGTFEQVSITGDHAVSHGGRWESTERTDKQVVVKMTTKREGKSDSTETLKFDVVDKDHLRLTRPELEKASIKYLEFIRKNPDAEK